MSDWEDFCESNGWNSGSEEDYEKFLDSLEDRPRRRIKREYNSATSVESLYFATFQEAVEWAKNNPGRVITRAPGENGYIARPEENSMSDTPQARPDKFSKEIQDWHKTLDKPLEKSDYDDCPNAEIQLPKAKPIRLKSVPVPKGVERMLRENYEVTSRHEWFEMIWGIYQYKKYNINACSIKSVGISHAGKCWAVSSGKHGQDLVYLIENPERFFIIPTAQELDGPGLN